MHEVPTLSLASGVRTSSLMLVYLSIFSKSSLSSSFMVRLPTYKSVEDTHSLSCSSCFIFKKRKTKNWSVTCVARPLLTNISSFPSPPLLAVFNFSRTFCAASVLAFFFDESVPLLQGRWSQIINFWGDFSEIPAFFLSFFLLLWLSSSSSHSPQVLTLWF